MFFLRYTSIWQTLTLIILRIQKKQAKVWHNERFYSWENENWLRTLICWEKSLEWIAFHNTFLKMSGSVNHQTQSSSNRRAMPLTHTLTTANALTVKFVNMKLLKKDWPFYNLALHCRLTKVSVKQIKEVPSSRKQSQTF